MAPDKQLVDLLKILVERFGAYRTLGEALATSYAIGLLREGKPLSLTDVAKATGCSKQNLSRWLQYQVEIGQAVTQPAEDDARMQTIDITDPLWAYRHLEVVAEIFGCDLDPPRSKRAVNGWEDTFDVNSGALRQDDS